MFPQPTKPAGELKLIDYYQQVDAHVPWVSAACSLDKQEQIDTTCNPNVDFGYDNNNQRSNSNGGRGGGNNFNRGGGRNSRRNQNGHQQQQNWGGYRSRFDFTKDPKRSEVAENIPKDQRCVQTNGIFSQEKYDAIVDYNVENKTQGLRPNKKVDLDHTDLGIATKMTTQVTQTKQKQIQHGTPFPNIHPSVCTGHILTSKKNKNPMNGMIGTTTIPIASFSFHSAEDIARGVVTDSIETATLLRTFHKGTDFRYEDISIQDFRQTLFYQQAMQKKHGGKDGDSQFWKTYNERACIGSVLPVLGEDGCEITKEQQQLLGEIIIDYNYTCEKHIRKRKKYYKNNFKSFQFFLDAHKKLLGAKSSKRSKKNKSSKSGGNPSESENSEISDSSENSDEEDEEEEDDPVEIEISKHEVNIQIQGNSYDMYEPNKAIDGYTKKVLKHYKLRKSTGKTRFEKYGQLLLKLATKLHKESKWKLKPKKKAKKVKKQPLSTKKVQKVVTIASDSSDGHNSSLDEDLEEEHLAELKKRDDDKKKAASATLRAAAKQRADAAKAKAAAATKAKAAAAGKSKPRRSPRHKTSAKNKRQRLNSDDELEDNHLKNLYPDDDDEEDDILGTFVDLKGKAVYMATIKEWVLQLDSNKYKMETTQGKNIALVDMAKSLDIDQPEKLYKNELCHHIAHARMVQITAQVIDLVNYDCSYPHELLQSGYSNAKARQRKARPGAAQTVPSEKTKKTKSRTQNGSQSVDSKKRKIPSFTLDGDEDAPSNIHDSSDGEE